MDATHVKARAGNKKMQKRIAREEALFFEDLLKKEINEDREENTIKAGLSRLCMICEDIRRTLEMKDLYSLRKETIERIFGTAKENHGFRYTQLFGRARMEMKAELTFVCMNLRKLARIKAKRELLEKKQMHDFSVWDTIRFIKEKWLWDTDPKAALSTV